MKLVTFSHIHIACPNDEFTCQHGRVDGQQPPCICVEQRCDNVTDCIGGEDELGYNCPCGPEGAVRLVDGIVPYRGRVEYCRKGRWASICNQNRYYWDRNDAAVVCRQLGYPSVGMVQLTHSFYLNYTFFHQFMLGARSQYTVGPQGQPVLPDIFHCSGNEKNLSQCRKNIGSNCRHSQDVSVICKNINTCPLVI